MSVRVLPFGLPTRINQNQESVPDASSTVGLVTQDGPIASEMVCGRRLKGIAYTLRMPSAIGKRLIPTRIPAFSV